jgi:hypothetical protein
MPRYQKFEFAQLLDRRVPNVNFSVGSLLGVAVVVEKMSPGTLEFPRGTDVLMRVDDVEPIFNPRSRNEDVQV